VLEIAGQTAAGQGVATDIIEAAARAYVRAISQGLRKAEVAERDPVELAPATP
jgi:2-isopropylmalate synthase